MKSFKDLKPNDIVYTIRTFDSNIQSPQLLKLSVIENNFPHRIVLKWVDESYGPTIKFDLNRDTEFEYKENYFPIYSDISIANKNFLIKNKSFLNRNLTAIKGLEKNLSDLIEVAIDVSNVIYNLEKDNDETII